MNKKIFVGLLFCVFCDFGAYADSCVKRDLKVTFSCRGGTPAGTLPADTVAIYGQNFDSLPNTTLSAFKNVCTPPSGYLFGGLGYYIDGQEVAFYDYANCAGCEEFVYRYKSDMEIGPKWISKSKVADMADIKNDSGSYIVGEYTAGSNGSWASYYTYGKVSGISRCSKVVPKFEERGFATTQDISSSGTGTYCWCKATAPAGQTWIYGDYNYQTLSNCSSSCASVCRGINKMSFFPTSVSGATN